MTIEEINKKIANIEEVMLEVIKESPSYCFMEGGCYIYAKLIQTVTKTENNLYINRKLDHVYIRLCPDNGKPFYHDYSGINNINDLILMSERNEKYAQSRFRHKNEIYNECLKLLKEKFYED